MSDWPGKGWFSVPQLILKAPKNQLFSKVAEKKYHVG
jgi:hypothetical protein